MMDTDRIRMVQRLLVSAVIILSIVLCSTLRAQVGDSSPLAPTKPEVATPPRTSAIIASILGGWNNRGVGIGYERVNQTFIGSISMYGLEVGQDIQGSRAKPVRRHTINLGYDINLGGRLTSWFGLYGGIGLFFPVYTYPNQTNVLQENESYSSSLNIGMQFYAWRLILGGGATYYLAYIYDPDFSDRDQEAFRNIWNINAHLGFRF
jgi:hypothetical protein